MGKRSRGASAPRFTRTDAAPEPPRYQPPPVHPRTYGAEVPAPRALEVDPASLGKPRPLLRDEWQRLSDLAYAARRRAEVAEAEAVRVGRRWGLSWDRIGATLDLSGETLRRRHAAVLLDQDHAAALAGEGAAR